MVRSMLDFRDNAAIAQLHLPSTMSGDFMIVGDNNNSAARLVKPVKQIQNIVPHVGIKIAGRFIGQNNGRIGYQCPCYGHTLALAAGKLIRFMVSAVRQAYRGKGGAGLGFGIVATGIEQRQFDIFEGGKPRQ